jgi:AcrR family transcriptional regulator
MKSPSPAPATASASPQVYHAHRERQRLRILAAAEKLFDERGIDRTTMAEIISAAGIRTSTLYQYFANKDEIVWAILGESIADSAKRIEGTVKTARSAFEKIAVLLEFMADELTNNPAKVRFMAQFDAMYARDWPAERLITLEEQITPNGILRLGTLIREGIADGSLRPDLDPDLTMHAVLNTVVGAQRRLASLDSRVELEYGQPIDRMFRETIRVILLGLRAPENKPKRSS